MVRWRAAAVLVLLAASGCGKRPAMEEPPSDQGPAAARAMPGVKEAGDPSELSQPQRDEPGVVRDGCPSGMVRVEGNDTLAPFCMGETEVSVGEFRRCVEAGECRAPDPKWDFDIPKKATWGGDPSMPINYVDGEQARHYCGFVGGRLATPEEWVWALGSAKGWAFPWGDEFTFQKDWHCGCWKREGQKWNETVPCTARQYETDRTLQGVYDMAGSLDEIITPNTEGKEGFMSSHAPTGVDGDPTSQGFRTKPMADAWYLGAYIMLPSVGIRCAADLDVP